eukprot:SAG22_NODE_99_length_20560_cov_128.669029_24_plen_75_part_00
MLVLVSHDCFIKLLLSTLLETAEGQQNQTNMLDCELLNTGTTAVEVDPLDSIRPAKLLWLNRVDHVLFAMAARL